MVFSILYFIFIRFRKINYTKYRKQTFRWIWILLILKLIIPTWRITSIEPNIIKNISKNISTTLTIHVSSGTENLLRKIQMLCDSYSHFFYKIWIVGFVISIMLVTLNYIYFHISLRRNLSKDNLKVKEIINTYKIPVSIGITEENTSPFVTGIFRKILILPKSFIELANQKDLDYIIQHEMVHIKKNDTLIKMLYIFARCIHWFNPLAYIMSKDFSMDLEMACDEVVAQKLSRNEKLEYCNVLYKYCTSNDFTDSIYNIGFSPAGNKIKERFDSILGPKKKQGIGIIIIACFLFIFTSLLIKDRPNNYSERMGNTITYIEGRDILIQSDQLTSPIILRKTEENSIVIEVTNENFIEVDLNTILSQGNIVSHISKEDYHMISDLQLLMWKDNNK